MRDIQIQQIQSSLSKGQDSLSFYLLHIASDADIAAFSQLKRHAPVKGISFSATKIELNKERAERFIRLLISWGIENI